MTNLKQRYLGHQNLNEFGLSGQKALQSAKIICIGAGGLASAVLPYLASSGVNHITIIDNDFIKASNLQRQVLFTEEDVGKSKVEVVRKHLQKIHSQITIRPVHTNFNHENAISLTENHNLIIDATDNMKTKFLINDVSCLLKIPHVYGAVSKYQGQVAIFDSNFSSCLRCFYSENLHYKDTLCSENGILAPLVGVIGSLQSTLAIQYLATGNKKNLGVVHLVDVYDQWNFMSRKILKNVQCPTCSEHLTRPQQII